VTAGPSSPRAVSFGFALAGALVVFSSLLRAATTTDAIAIIPAVAFALWALMPYAVLAVMGRLISNRFAVGGAGVLVLVLECALRAAIFVWPRSSTAAVALVFSPVWLTVVALPVGGVAGFVFGRMWRSGHVVVRFAAVALAASALAWVAIAVARPELLPTAVLFRRRMLERVGEPRVVTRGDWVETTSVSKVPAWFQAANLDGSPGDEIAIVENNRIDILDGVTLEKRQSLPLGGDGRLWNWYSRLALLDARLVIVQTGGGFSDTEVRSTDGNLIWAYRPDPALAPTALRPGDLDGDGVLEFYASTRDALVRLDAAGKEVWNQRAEFDSIVDLAPRTESERALVVGSAYEGRMLTWNELGQSLGRLNSTRDGVPVSIIDFPRGRAIATVGSTLQVIGLDGKILFERPSEEGMRYVSAVSLRPGGNALPYLALVLQAAKDIGRARLLLIDTADKVVYDELFGKTPSIFKAAAPDGAESLLVAADGLRRLRLKIP
jgi:hypothetical protein